MNRTDARCLTRDWVKRFRVAIWLQLPVRKEEDRQTSFTPAMTCSFERREEPFHSIKSLVVVRDIVFVGVYAESRLPSLTSFCASCQSMSAKALCRNLPQIPSQHIPKPSWCRAEHVCGFA